MKLIVGLGNPGKEYEDTRHNVGFKAIDQLVDRFNISNISEKFQAHFASVTLGEEKIFLAKPQTYMNLSGNSVRQIKDYYKIDIKDIIVIHDDIDLEFGKIKIKIGGGSGGQNGIKSLDSAIGNNYLRVRFGIGRPDVKSEVSNYVLSRFSKSEMQEVERINKLLAENIELLFVGKSSELIKILST